MKRSRGRWESQRRPADSLRAGRAGGSVSQRTGPLIHCGNTRSSDAFLVAAKTGDFELLLSFLSPDVELVADASAIAMGAPTTLVGPHDVASRFSGGAKAARLALLDGLAGLVWAQGGTPKVAFDFTVVAGKVSRIEMIADHDVLDEIDIAFVRRGATNAES